MKFSHRIAIAGGVGFILVIYLVLVYFNAMPDIFSSHQEKLRNFIAQNPLTFHLTGGRPVNGQCSSEFNIPRGVVSTQDLAERTNYKSSGGDYILPHPSIEQAAYSSDLEPLTVLIVPHSHVDPGWVETVDEYYTRKVRAILDGMVRKLHLYPDLTFIWAEIVYFSRWWEAQTHLVQLQVKDLIKQGRLEMVLSGWVMPDEASTSYSSVIDQLTEGHQWLYSNLGIRPTTSWSVDPFGHSGTMAYLWKQAGMENMVIGRIHQATKGQMIREQSLEFYWRQFWESSDDRDIFCHVMPYMIYSLHRTCGPDQYICAQFDFKQRPGDPMNVFVKPIGAGNIKEKAKLLYEQYRLKGSLFKHNTIMVPLGDDFRFDMLEEWDQQYENYKQLMDYMNAKPEWKIKVKFGTLSEFFKQIKKSESSNRLSFPTIAGDFFPYSDHDSSYWTGYFTTRPFDKRFCREVESKLRAAEILHSLAISYSKKWETKYVAMDKLAVLLIKARRYLGLFLHHDAITGTGKAYVVEDYENKLFSSFQKTGIVLNSAMQYLLTQGKLTSEPSIFEQELTRVDGKQSSLHGKITVSKIGTRVAMLNPTGHFRSEFVEFIVDSVDLEIKDAKRKSLPFQINPVYTSATEIDRTLFEVVFLSEIPAFGIETYIFQKTTKTPKSFWSSIKIHNSDEFIVAPELKFEYDRPRRHGNVYEPIFLENEQIGAEFKSFNGLLTKLVEKYNNKTKETQVLLDFKQYQSRGSGAYIFFPSGPASDIVQPVPIIRVVEGPFYSEVQVVFYCMYHRARLYNHPGLQGRNLLIQNTLNMFALNMRDKEPIMRISTDLLNERGTFFTDQNGFQFIQRKRHPTDVNYQNIERNYYPMTTMAFLQDSMTRVTLHSGQSLGVASLEKGWLEVMLDRQLLYDDGRGLGEGISDNKLTITKFILQIEQSETVLREETFSYPSINSIVTNEFLNQPLQRMFSLVNSDIISLNFLPMLSSLPCDISLVSLKTLFNGDHSYNETGVVLHRRGFRCGFRDDGAMCSEKDVNLVGLFPTVKDNYVKETSLVHTLKKESRISLKQLSVSPMEIKSIVVQIPP
ncbi:hypothetical protein DPMN_086650 [Dreissena polymorpha]|uniref:Alpha-mannosidase n=2 Tax=Dreissena polymorpha TaxID=45954 RepID=A0A9D4KS94_DREPO|nr:hypothetical protein DPMN_086650 [Dreissena polymorpha]